jgi:hypothetical protein
MAGHTIIGFLDAKSTVETKSSAIPQAILAKILAVAGATKKNQPILLKRYVLR